MRRLLSCFLLNVIIVNLLVGCSGADDAVSNMPVTFVLYNADGKEQPWTDPIARQITKRTGVTLDIDYPVNSDNKRIPLMIASGEYPDLIFAKGESEQLIEAGALIDLSDLIEQYGPNIKKLYGDQYEKLRTSKEDKSIYQLCSLDVNGDITTTSGTAQLQWAVLKENDYVIPKTLYSYEKVIKMYMKKYPVINGKNTIGISLCCSDWHWYTTLSNPAGFIANGAVDNGQWIINDGTYKASYKTSVKGQKEYFRWLNQMYTEGILDSEFATQTREEYLEKIADGRILGLMDSYWDYEDAQTALRASNQYERTYAGLPVTMNESVRCSSLKKQGLGTGWGIGITKACKDPVRAVKFLDYICSEEGQILLGWGIEGINYYVDEEGKRCRTEQEIKRTKEDTTYKESTGVGLYRYPFPHYGANILDSTKNPFSTNSTETLRTTYDEEQKAALKAWNVDDLTDIFPSSDEFWTQDYAPIWSMSLPKEITKLQERLDQISWKGLINCIICSSDEFEETWNKMQSDLEKAGRKKAETLLTEYIKKQVNK